MIKAFEPRPASMTAGARRPDDEDWWRDVLHDPRGNPPRQARGP